MARQYKGKRVNGGAVFARKAAALKASEEGETCAICLGPIDTTLPASEFNSPEYFTIDHDPPLHLREKDPRTGRAKDQLSGMRPAHRRCNSSEGGRMGRAKQGLYNPVSDAYLAQIEHSRDW